MTIPASQAHPRIILYRKDGSLPAIHLSLWLLILPLLQTTPLLSDQHNEPTSHLCTDETLHRPFQKGKGAPNDRFATLYSDTKAGIHQSFLPEQN